MTECFVTGCSECVDNNNTCSVCDDGYYLKSSFCIGCSTELAHCLKCSDVNTCIVCDTQYTPIDGKCVIACDESVTNCFHCSTPVMCNECDDGYYLDETCI